MWSSLTVLVREPLERWAINHLNFVHNRCPSTFLSKECIFNLPTIDLHILSISLCFDVEGLLLLSAPDCTMLASSEVRSDNPYGAAGKAAGAA